MQSPRIFLSLVSALLIVVSCNNKKTINPAQATGNSLSSTANDTLTVFPADAIDITCYTNGFTEAVTQKFTVTAGRSTIVTAKKGLKITVDPAKLVKEDGSAVNGKIDLEIVELTNSYDLFRSNAATVCNDMLLSSGGSYFIGMECNGQKLRLKEGKALQVSFPVLSEEEMQLFYGERDEDNNMNWKRTAVLLLPQNEDINFTDANRYETNEIPEPLSELGEARIYRTLSEPVYYYNTRMTLKELVDTINSKGPKVCLQTISFWPKNLPTDRVLDTNYLTTIYGPRLQYILRNCKALQQDEIALEQKKALRDSMMKNWKPSSLSGQLQKYYAASDIKNLGWINCDRFYQYQQQTEVELELPIAFNNSNINYFIIFKSFNGLMNGKLIPDEDSKIILKKMPVGEKITLLAFTKSQGVIYQSKEDFKIEKNKKISPQFKTITEEDLKKMFAGNVRTN